MPRILNATTLVFVAIAGFVVLWIGSGMIGRAPPEAPARAEPSTPVVAASWSEAGPVTQELVMYGDVEPSQRTVLRARVDGIVEELPDEGARVAEGDLLVRLSTDDRLARLAQAEAQLASAARDYDAAQQLAERGVGSEAEAQARAAQLEAARAGLRAIEIEIANTELRAPGQGVISEVMVEPGAYVSVGGEVLEVVDNDPLIAVANVQQSGVSQVRPGMPAEVRFIGGAQKSGTVRFVAPVADAATRTFRVEVEIANDEEALPAGLSAEITIPFATQPAHRVSAALGRLDDQGRLGLYIIDDESRIRFAPIEVIRAQADGIWVTGLPERAHIVTISQGSLADGQPVEVRETPAEYVGAIGTGGEQGTALDLAEEGRLPLPPDVPQEGAAGIPNPAAEER